MRTIDELLEPGTALTYEDFQRIYYYHGLDEMIRCLKQQFSGQSKERLSSLIKTIFYGYNIEGLANDKPRVPDPFLMVENEFLYDFQGRVWNKYVQREAVK